MTDSLTQIPLALASAVERTTSVEGDLPPGPLLLPSHSRDTGKHGVDSTWHSHGPRVPWLPTGLKNSISPKALNGAMADRNGGSREPFRDASSSLQPREMSVGGGAHDLGNAVYGNAVYVGVYGVEEGIGQDGKYTFDKIYSREGGGKAPAGSRGDQWQHARRGEEALDKHNNAVDDFEEGGGLTTPPLGGGTSQPYGLVVEDGGGEEAGSAQPYGLKLTARASSGEGHEPHGGGGRVVGRGKTPRGGGGGMGETHRQALNAFVAADADYNGGGEVEGRASFGAGSSSDGWGER